MAKILIHGGAWNARSSTIRSHEQEATDRTCARVEAKGVSALDLVAGIVAAQEDEDALDAGTGSILQLDGRIRMDAGICDSKGHYGAVLQIEDVRNPIRVARRLMEYGYHSILSGDGARAFAREEGFPPYSPYIKEAEKLYARSRERFPEINYAALVANMGDINKKKMGTVGAVALDDAGNLAAACSTGGLTYGYPGRVGDTAIYGAGVYCSNHVAVACTGEGDKMLRRLTARHVEDGFLKHGNLQQALDEAVEDLMREQNGYCGLIAVAADGQSGHSKSTTFMSLGVIG